MPSTKKKNTKPKERAVQKRVFFTFGLDKEREYFVENLSMLIAGGMPIVSVLDSIAIEMRSKRMKTIVMRMRDDLIAGAPLWQTLANAKIFPAHAISLIRLGEASGNLVENLKVVAIEQEKNRVFKSKLRSAMMYPVFVLSLTLLIGIGIAWFILPKLALVFSQLKIELPLITEVLINTGLFLSEYGKYVVPPGLIAIGILFFFIFSFSKTKFIGQYILFATPGVKGLIQEVEIARFGYLLGTLLEAGLPITDALDSLAHATEIRPYQKLYAHLRDSIGEGNSVQESFTTFPRVRRLIPSPVQQLIVAGERSGTLSQILLKIGHTFETKADTTTKNLTVILEPILLVIVWLGVVSVALAVILPIYSLIGGLNAGPANIAPAATEQTAPQTVEIIQEKLPSLIIIETDSDYLNVREGASASDDIITKVTEGDIFHYLSEKEGWYEIELPDGGTGWVVGTYVALID